METHSHFIKGNKVSIVPYGKVFVIEIVDKFGVRKDYGSSCFSIKQAKERLQKCIGEMKGESRYEKII